MHPFAVDVHLSTLLRDEDVTDHEALFLKSLNYDFDLAFVHGQNQIHMT